MCDFEHGAPHAGHIKAVLPQAGLYHGINSV